MLRFFVALSSMLLLLSACRAVPSQQAAQRPVREPAAVMTWHGADWLERPEREREERPDLVLAEMKLKNGDIVAEVGAGSGYFARRIARAVAPTGRVIANDIQPEMLDLVRRLAAREQLSNLETMLGTDTDPRLPAGSLDWVILVDVYHEFQQPAPMLAKMREALKDDGRIMLVEYRAEGTSAAHIKTEHRMSREQVLAEWLPAGFKLERIVEALPSQRMFVFAKG